MSKRRHDSRLGENSQVPPGSWDAEVHLWNQVKSQLDTISDIQEKLDASGKSKGTGDPDTESMLRNNYQTQLKLYNDAIESLSVLIALRENPDTFSPGLPEKRKRKNNTLQNSRASSTVNEGTPSSSIPSSPAPSGRSSGSPAPGPGPSRLKSASGGPTGSSVNKNLNNRKSYLSKTKQLPLRTGRSVVAKPNKGNSLPDGSPNSSIGERGRGGGDDDWILGEIVECIGGDKNRYVVKDSDPLSADSRWNMTLKTIIPLPDPKNRAMTYPERDYPVGSYVLALYPDTTSFYRAKVIEMGANRHYRLLFEDDEETPREVPEEYVTDDQIS